jgi:hypothetical protein
MHGLAWLENSCQIPSQRFMEQACGFVASSSTHTGLKLFPSLSLTIDRVFSKLFRLLRYSIRLSQVTDRGPAPSRNLAGVTQRHIAVCRRPAGHKMSNNKYFFPMEQKHTAENACLPRFLAGHKSQSAPPEGTIQR